MRKFIYSNHELDLSKLEVTIVKENHWFSDRFFTKFSFPVEMSLTSELNLALGNVMDHNASDIVAYVEGFYYEYGEEHQAVMELERLTDVASFIIRFGFDELPNWDKKLAALPLQQVNLTGTNIRAHATTVLDLEFPSVNYNFPQIHINSLDIESDQWQYFSERLNARDSNSFLVNEYDSVADEQINRTIVQPLPHLLHVIKQGFTDLGFTVSGDIFSDSAFAKAYIFHFSEYYRSFNSESFSFTVARDEDTVSSGFPDAIYYDSYTSILQKGRYQITGTAILYGTLKFLRIFVDGVKIYDYTHSTSSTTPNYENLFIDVSFNIDPGNSSDVRFYAAQYPYEEVNGQQINDSIWLDVSIAQISKFGPDGELLSTLIDADTVDLRKCVPDMTFGELMTILKNQFAIDIIPQGDHYQIDLIKNQIDENEIIDLSDYEVRYPQRSFSQGDVYALNYPEIESEDFIHKGVMVTKDGVEPLNDQLLSNDVQDVSIEFLPLPLKTLSTRRTAVQIGEDNSALYIVRYDGLQYGENYCIDSNLAVLDIYDTYLSRLYDFKINGQPYQWSLLVPELVAKRVKERSRVFAYNKIFVVEKIQTTNQGRDVVQMRLDLIAHV